MFIRDRVCREQKLRATLQYLKDSGFRIVAATEKGDYDYTKADYTGPLCIIMGAEDTGCLSLIHIFGIDIHPEVNFV